MKVREIKNTSKGILLVQMEDGQVALAPGVGTRNVRISEAEMKRIQPRVLVKLDLTEVKGLLD